MMVARSLPIARRTRQPLLIAWLALCVLVVQGLLPLAQARMALPRAGTTGADVCSSGGLRGLASRAQALPFSLAMPDTSDMPETAAAHARCWACLVMAQAAVALPPLPIALPVPTSRAGVPLMLPAGAEPRPTRGLATPRAPPHPS